MLSSEKIRQILNNHRERMESLASELTRFKQDNQDLKAKVEGLNHALRQVQINSQRHTVISSPQSVPPKISMGDTQLMMLLNNIGALNRASPVSATAIKQAFHLSDSERTIMRRLNSLEQQSVIEHIGSRPKLFYINENGLVLLQRERRSTLRTVPIALGYVETETA
jgi:chromosome segregation ATPase